MAFLAPEIRLVAFPAGETAPVTLPAQTLASVESRRSLSGGSLALRFAAGSFADSGTWRTVSEALRDETVLQLLVRRSAREPFRQLNLGVVHGLNSRGTASGQIVFAPLVGSLEDKLQNQELFISRPDEERQPTAGETPASGFDAGITALGRAFRDVTDLRRLLTTLWDDVVVALMNPERVGGETIVFGGRRLVAPTTGGDGFAVLRALESPGYTDGFLHVFSYFGQIRFGASPNFYSLFTGLCAAPLYEFFCDPLEGPGLLDADPTARYEVAQGRALLVFRKTPFEELFDADGVRRPVERRIPEAFEVSNEVALEEAYSGVHVGLSQFGDDQTNTLVFPPRISGRLQGYKGYKILQVRLDGVGVNGSPDTDIGARLEGLRNRLFAAFCGGADGRQPLRNSQSVVEAPFDFYRVGEPLQFPQWDAGFGNVGYVTDVVDRFDVAQARAHSKVTLQWVDRPNALPQPR